MRLSQVIKVLEKRIMTEKYPPQQTYLIHHEYDIGDRGIYVESSFDPTDAAVYLQFKAEALFNDDGISLSNLAIANALVALYGVTCGARTEDAKPIDMHFERESRCGKWFKSDKGFLDPFIQQSDDKIIEVLKHHVGDQ